MTEKLKCRFCGHENDLVDETSAPECRVGSGCRERMAAALATAQAALEELRQGNREFHKHWKVVTGVDGPLEAHQTIQRQAELINWVDTKLARTVDNDEHDQKGRIYGSMHILESRAMNYHNFVRLNKVSDQQMKDAELVNAHAKASDLERDNADLRHQIAAWQTVTGCQTLAAAENARLAIQAADNVLATYGRDVSDGPLLHDRIVRLGRKFEAAESLAADMQQVRRRLYLSHGGWIYQGNEDDHLDSLTCPVIIQPQQLRELLADRDRYRRMAEEFVTEQDISESRPDA